jgi:hypothetical protein
VLQGYPGHAMASMQSGDDPARAARRSLIADGLLAGGLAVLLTVGAYFASHQQPMRRPFDAGAAALVILAAGSLVARRRQPVAVHAYLDQEGNTLSIVQVHPDSASMEFHMQVNAKHFATAFDWLDTSIGQQLFGPISDGLAAELAKWDDPYTHVPVHEAGFTRTTVR